MCRLEIRSNVSPPPRVNVHEVTVGVFARATCPSASAFSVRLASHLRPRGRDLSGLHREMRLCSVSTQRAVVLEVCKSERKTSLIV